MKTYYIKYPRDFDNEYDLCWIDHTDSAAIEDATKSGWKRITCKAALGKINDEKERRFHDPDFAFLAPIAVLPYFPGSGHFVEEIDRYTSRITFDVTGKSKKLHSTDGIIFE